MNVIMRDNTVYAKVRRIRLFNYGELVHSEIMMVFEMPGHPDLDGEFQYVTQKDVSTIEMEATNGNSN